MFESTVELITQAASNSLVIFCFCNLIIVMILMGSKTVSNFDQEREIPRSMVINTHTQVKADIVAKLSSLNGNKKLSLDENKISIDDREVSISPEEPTGDDNDEENGNDNEDDLRRRIEEFINKVNQGWRTELSRHHVLA